MKHKLLLITPPFTQLNTPYPATAYIKGFLNTQSVDCRQMDLGIDTILKLFTRSSIELIFAEAEKNIGESSDNSYRIYALRERYIDTIESVISFLQDEDPTLSHLIITRNFLPEASKFEQLEELEWAFGSMGIRDQARHLATLYLEDIGDFIVEMVDPHFGFSRYAERLGISAGSFDELHDEVEEDNSIIVDMMLDILKEEVDLYKPTLACMSVPFPGNLFAALKCGRWLKENYPSIKIAIGGGYPNTELRSISDERVFKYIDFITLDDGEAPLITLLQYLNKKIDITMLKRTFVLDNGVVSYLNGSLMSDIQQEKVGTPDYSDLPLKKYLSVIQVTNPMHRLWSDGRWNKLTMAHGCYWGKCTFCDVSLSYIKNYEASSAELIVDRMEELIENTGERGFHFVDEAAPPALMKAIALEILKRKVVATWWTNIRFEKSFTSDLCRLLAASGCIAVSGGLEVASDRLLALIDKGVTIEQVSRVNENFNQAGIMVHAYLMYGFPTQTEQETIDSLEVVRQMFVAGVMQSAFWHRFAMTAHSPVGLAPAEFNVINQTEQGKFANNDLYHTDPSGADHDLYGEGLKVSLYNFMHGVGLDYDIRDWFEFEVAETSLPPDLIQGFIADQGYVDIKPRNKIYWIEGPVLYDDSNELLHVFTQEKTIYISIADKKGRWLENILNEAVPSSVKAYTYSSFKHSYEDAGLEDFTIFWHESIMEELRQLGLLIL